MADVHRMAMQARDELFEDLKEFTDDDMSVMTCCDPWTVKHVVAHLTALGNQSVPNFMLGMLKAREASTSSSTAISRSTSRAPSR